MRSADAAQLLTELRARGRRRRWLHAAALAVVAALLLAGCSLLEDILPGPPEPVELLPEGSCGELTLNESGATAELVGTWAAPGTNGGELEVTRVMLPTPASPPNEANMFPAGPDAWGNRYPPLRNYFAFECDGLLGVTWQAPATGEILVTLFTPDRSRAGTWSLPLEDERLIAAAFGNGRLYMLTTDVGTLPPSAAPAARLTLHAYTFGQPAGEALASTLLNTSRDGFNMVQPTNPWVSTLAYSSGKLALILARQMHTSADGLNHQGAVAALFSSETLQQLSYMGQTSGHSFGVYMTPTQDGRFVAIDMGDNYPRGINLHHIEGGRQSRVVYTFKTLHGTTPQSPAGVTYPVYAEISGEQTYYQWSNDNNVYSELGSVIEFDDGYLVTFIGEPDEQGRALRNDRARDYAGDARNVGIVKVVKNFATAGQTPNVVTDDVVLSGGPGSVTEEGGFYTFGGQWAPQRNAGVRWVTDYDDVQTTNASRLIAVRSGPDSSLLVWETWTATEYVATHFAVISTLGEFLTPPTTLGGPHSVRVPRSDDPFEHGGKVYMFGGSGMNLVVSVFDIGD